MFSYLLRSGNYLLSDGVDLQVAGRTGRCDEEANLLDILFDCGNYEFSTLLSRSVHMITRIFSVQSDLFSLATKGMLLLPARTPDAHPDSVDFLATVDKV